MNFITRYNLARDRKVTVANLVDELLYNERGNAVMFLKYLEVEK